MKSNPIHRFKTISEYHRYRGLAQPEHPLVSLINFEEMKYSGEDNPMSWSMDFYSIALKRNINGKIKYGLQKYDFDEGVLFFIAAGQIFSIEADKNKVLETSGWMLLVHPDFFMGNKFGTKNKKIRLF